MRHNVQLPESNACFLLGNSPASELICLPANKINVNFLQLRMDFATTEVKGKGKQVTIFLTLNFL